MMEGVLGRHAEQETLESLLQQGVDGDGPVEIMLTGDAGIGKTSIWSWAVRTAQRRGLIVLQARAVEAELPLPWVTLTDLLRGVDAATLSMLPAPQRHALEVATLRAMPKSPVLDQRAVSTALATLLVHLAHGDGFVLAIDDITHVDDLTARALAFSLRRLSDSARALIVVTARGAPSEISEHRIVSALPPGRRHQVVLGPLTIPAIGALLRDRLHELVSPSLLAAIHSTSAGNPLYALEIGRAIECGEIQPSLTGPLPIPRHLTDLVAGRVDRLDDALRDLVASTVAASRLPVTAVPAPLLRDAVDEGVVVIDDGVVRAAHPLISAAAYASLDIVARAALHRRLAASTDDAIERARHLALSTSEPDPAVAAALDVGTDEVEARGGPAAAAVLARLAVEHNGDDEAGLLRRLTRLGDLQFRAGDVADAVATLRKAVAILPPSPPRARLRVRLAEMLSESDGLARCVAELLDTLPEADGDPTIAAEAHLTLSAVYYADIDASTAHADEALSLLADLPDPDPAILAGALCQRAGARFRNGRGLDHHDFLRAIDLERQFPSRRLSDRADASYAALLKYADELDEAEERLTALLHEAEASHDMTSLAYVHAHLPQIFLWRGDLHGARLIAEQHLAIAESTAQADQVLQAHYLLGLIAAHQGDADRAARHLDKGGSPDHPWAAQRIHGARGFLALSLGDTQEAVTQLRRWWQVSNEIGLREPGLSRFHVDHTLALTGAGHLDEAVAFAKTLDEQVQLSGRKSAAATVSLTRALVAAAQQRHDEAREEMEHSLAIHAELPLRFERARALLVSGRLYRRAKAKRAARDDFEAALTEFEAFGAALWAEQTRLELDRVNTRTAPVNELTTTERRVAELIASGMSNREGRGDPLPLTEDGRGQRVEDLPKARHRVTRGVGRTTRPRRSLRASPFQIEGFPRFPACRRAPIVRPCIVTTSRSCSARCSSSRAARAPSRRPELRPPRRLRRPLRERLQRRVPPPARPTQVDPTGRSQPIPARC